MSDLSEHLKTKKKLRNFKSDFVENNVFVKKVENLSESKTFRYKKKIFLETIPNDLKRIVN